MIRAFLTLGLLLLPFGAGAFADVPAVHESRRAIEYLQREGVLQGYADGLFRPAFPINRAEFLKVLVTGRGVEPSVDLYNSCFPDVLDQWYAPYVCYAAMEGWVEGYPDGTFGPERTVTFAEALKMLSNARGYPLAPAEESLRRGIDPSAWFAPYLTTSLLVDIVSFEQVWGSKATPLQANMTRGFIAQLLYRAHLAEGLVSSPIIIDNCTIFPTALEIKTYVDVLMPARINIFRQEIRGVDDDGGSCLLAADANPFGRVAFPFDAYFLQPYPQGQPKDSWVARVPLHDGRATLRGGELSGAFRPEVFVADVLEGQLRQLPSIFASPGGSIESFDHRYIIFIGSAGRTLEVVDLVGGTHAVLDSVEAPHTFVASKQGGQNLSFAFEGLNILSYALYDSSIPAEDGFLLLEVRSVDIDAVFGSGLQNPDDPLAPPSEEEDPYADFGETDLLFP